jgi:hypothetical protein
MNTCECRRNYLKYHKIYIPHQHTKFKCHFRIRRQFQMVSHKNYNLNVNEDFVIFLTSKLILFFIDAFTSGMKSQSMAYLLGGSAHIYWI